MINVNPLMNNLPVAILICNKLVSFVLETMYSPPGLALALHFPAAHGPTIRQQRTPVGMGTQDPRHRVHLEQIPYWITVCWGFVVVFMGLNRGGKGELLLCHVVLCPGLWGGGGGRRLVPRTA